MEKVGKEETLNRKGRETKTAEVKGSDLEKVVLTLAFRMGEDKKA